MVLLNWSAVAISVAEITLPAPDETQPIRVTADSAHRWNEGSREVWVLTGRCIVQQGNRTSSAEHAVLWVDRGGSHRGARHSVTAYLEGDVRIAHRSPMKKGVAVKRDAQVRDAQWLGRYHSRDSVQIRIPRVSEAGTQLPDIYRRAAAYQTPRPRRKTNSNVRLAQFTFPGPPAPADPVPQGTRRVRIFPRSGRVQAEWFRSPNGREWVAVVDSGVTLLVDGIEGLGAIDVSTDRLVIWIAGGEQPDLLRGSLQRDDLPLEIYMEGNIEFRQGDRVIYADRMYYDVTKRTGTVLSAEILTPAPSINGMIRLRADSVQQVNQDSFVARGASITTSQLGVPRYAVTAETITLEDHQHPSINPFTGEVDLDADGQPIITHQRMATSGNNLMRIEGFPIFYWPTLATDLEKPTLYLDRIDIESDRVYGTQVYSHWDAYQLFGIRNPLPGTEWDLGLHYLSKRGPAASTAFFYDWPQLFGIAGPTAGFVDVWGVFDDQGLDQLGRGRRDLIPEASHRGRILHRHRQRLPFEFQLTAQFGYISDRTFLEQYFETEWDTFKDQTSDFELKRTVDNRSFTIFGASRINDFVTETEWIPRVDHHWLGQSLLWDRFTWYAHTHAGYARMKVGEAPSAINPTELAMWAPLPYEANVQGERIATRQEIDLPFQLGPVKVVPYALGEAAHWGADLTGDDTQRLYGQVGVRMSMPMWKAEPLAESELWNVHGLAHKVLFEFEFAHAESSRDVTDFALYDPIDDDSTEDFRRRFAFDPAFDAFGASPPVAARFDPRFYAIRSGLGSWVTSPAVELVDDLTALRFGVHQRWQTKRGMPGQRRITDWITLDVDATLFPKKDRDNFGQSLGLLDYDFRWHVGDRVTILSDGIFDFFSGGQEIFTVGALLDRPGSGSLYLGFRSLNGPISSQQLAAALNYQMSQHWITTMGATVDLAENINIGQNLSITRLGESFNIRLNMNVDAGRDDFGVGISIEPRFLGRSRLARTDATRLPLGGLRRP